MVKIHIFEQKAKRFVRNNEWPVGDKLRCQIWKATCNNKNFDVHKKLYHEQINELSKFGVKNIVPLFTLFDGVVVYDHGLSETDAVTLQQLLIVVECFRPDIRYIPIIYPLCAVLLHHMSPDDTFACIMQLLSRGNKFLIQSEASFYASAQTILALLKKHKRKVYNCIKVRCENANDLKLSEIFNDWASWIFKHLPYACLVRVIDCFLVEGHKMLLRIVLTLCYLWYKEKGKIQPDPEVDQIWTLKQKMTNIQDEIKQIGRSFGITSPELIDTAKAIRWFKSSTIKRFQKSAEARYRGSTDKTTKAQISSTNRILTNTFESGIVDNDVVTELIYALPERFQLGTPESLFLLSRDGVSFNKLWRLIDRADQTLLIIRTTRDEVIGAYCSVPWIERKSKERAKTRYFGTGESFVFHRDNSVGLPNIYHWSGLSSETPGECPQLFMTAGESILMIGGDAICIREELWRGLSQPSPTFASPALVKNGEFEIVELEVFGIVNY